MKRTLFRRFLPLLCGALVAHLSTGLAQAEVVAPEVAESGPVIVTTETAEVRVGPAPSYDVITVVAKGEIFDKQGRTGAWYYIRINDDNFGWISGRAISRYQADGTPSTYVEPRDAPVERGGDYSYYPYYPDNYYGYFYDYPFYFWGQPYFSSDYYYYDYYRYRSYPRERVNVYPRNRVYPRYRNDDWQRGSGPHRYYNGGRLGVPAPRPPVPVPGFNNPAHRPSLPRVRPSFPRR